jgi:short-subunit dehydrogenase
VLGVINGCRLAFDFLPAGGLVINIGSIVGIIQLPIVPVYCASKAAVIAYTRLLMARLHTQKK